MIKMEVVMNDEKILADDKFDLQGVYDVIRKAYEEQGLNYNAKDKCFYGKGDTRDLGRFGNTFGGLMDTSWFKDNVKSAIYYKWYKNDESDMVIEDWLYEWDK